MSATISEETAVRPKRWDTAEYARLGELGFFQGEKVELRDGEVWTQPPESEPRPRVWSKRDYYRLAELGFFDAQKVELIEGRLMVQSPQHAPHASGVLLSLAALQAVFTTGCHVRPQLPVDLGQANEPEPDVAVVAGTLQQYLQAHPTAALLVVEVADSSLASDRGRKGSLYARAGVLDYWIVNLVDNQVEVYRNPVADATQPYCYRYDNRADLHAGDAITPVALPSASVAVADLLP